VSVTGMKIEVCICSLLALVPLQPTQLGSRDPPQKIFKNN